MVHRRQEPYDDNGHGTHISGNYRRKRDFLRWKISGGGAGVPYHYGQGAGSEGNGYASDVLAGIKWIRENRERLGIRIVNISVGSFTKKGMSENSVLVRGVNAAWDDGLVVCVAAGNMGPERTP